MKIELFNIVIQFKGFYSTSTFTIKGTLRPLDQLLIFLHVQLTTRDVNVASLDSSFDRIFP